MIFQFDGVCLNDRCQCPPDHHYVNGTKCFKNVPLNSPCTMDGECVEHASCLKYICTCDHGYTVNSNVCSGEFGSNSVQPLQIWEILYCLDHRGKFFYQRSFPRKKADF